MDIWTLKEVDITFSLLGAWKLGVIDVSSWRMKRFNSFSFH